MERRGFLVAGALASLSGTVWVQSAHAAIAASGPERVAMLGGRPLGEGSTIHAVPEVYELIQAQSAHGELARHWVRFLNGITGRDGLTVDDVCTPDVRCIELELAGIGGGIETLRGFRASMNGSLEDGPTLLEEMIVYPEYSTIEVRLHGGGKHIGPIAGVPATGKNLYYDVQTLNHFRGDRMALRWDRTNLMEKLQELARG